MGNTFSSDCGCGERVRASQGKVFIGEEVGPTRTCLPQVDPLPSHRLTGIRAEGVLYEVELMNKTGKKETRKPLATGWPLALPQVVGDCEEFTRYYSDFTNIEAQILETIQEHMGPEAEQYLCGEKGRERWGSFAEASKTFFKQKRGFPKPAVASCWWDDQQVSRLRLTGAMTGIMKQILRTDHLPSSLGITDEHVIGRIGSYGSFKEACSAGRIFAVDYSQTLRPVVSFGMVPCTAPPPPPANEWEEPEPPPEPTPNVIANPVMVFFMENNGQLMPIAIRLFIDPPEGYLVNNPVYTPDDSVWAWTMAKMYFNQAELHYHLIGVLAVQIVLATAAIHCMAQRSLSTNHPVRQLLRPHLTGCLPFAGSMFGTFLNSSLATQILSLTDDGIKGLATSAYTKYDFSNDSFKHEWRERMREQADLPMDYYVADSLQWWTAIETFVKSVCSKYYARPEDVEGDVELREWIRDLSNRLTRVKEIHPCRPLDSVVFNVTTIIFNSSVGYAGKTKGIYDSYAAFWAFPAKLHGVPFLDKPKDLITEADLVQLLPTKKESLLQIGLAYVLNELHHAPQPPQGGQESTRDKSSCSTPFKGCTDFVDQASNGFEKKLQESLKQIAENIDTRNASLEFPFTHLHPYHSVKPSFGSF
eukprot:TRINITY_DN11246_c0_g1_i1.p1 TRINITY_DN11246_c0_g1~~TRINITY_DN11246_c0_g1_i1.p1  ORF type:complete len:666 (+),score=110.33 TRINITY_DN11246_c0_g1_i1:65-1999(+)